MKLSLDGNNLTNTPIPGRPLASFNQPWGYKGDNSYYNTTGGLYAQGRTFASFAVGLKF